MTVTDRSRTPARTGPDAATGPSAERVLARSVFGRSWKQAVLVGVGFAAVAVSSATAYASTYPTGAERRALAGSLGGGSGLEVVFGEVDRIGSVGGYTAYKSFVFLTTIGAVWAALAVTRLLRGEEDRGRWQLVVATRTDAASATRATLVSLAAAVALALVVVVGATAVVGRRSDLGLGVAGSAAFGASMLAPAFVYGALAACGAQLGRTRRVADALVAGGIGLGFVLRMIGDVGGDLGIVSWLTPFGWAELVHPWTDDDLRPLVLAVVATGLLGAVAVRSSARRDVGAGILTGRDAAPLRPFGLGSTAGLAVRGLAPVVGAWAVGTLALAVVLGVVTETVEAGVGASSSAGAALTDLGATGPLTTQYLGVCFLLLGALVALVPASHLAAARDDERSGRTALLLAGPVRRGRWPVERLLLADASVLVLGPAGGLAVWAGAAVRGLRLDLASLLLAGLNVVPVALVVVGLGAGVWAIRPRAASAAVYLVVTWSLLADLVGALVSGAAPLRALSLFHHVAPLPAGEADAGTIVVLVGLAVLLQVLAGAALARRDQLVG